VSRLIFMDQMVAGRAAAEQRKPKLSEMEAQMSEDGEEEGPPETIQKNGLTTVFWLAQDCCMETVCLRSPPVSPAKNGRIP
jgi:hypothetical protein